MAVYGMVKKDDFAFIVQYDKSEFGKKIFFEGRVNEADL